MEDTIEIPVGNNFYTVTLQEAITLRNQLTNKINEMQEPVVKRVNFFVSENEKRLTEFHAKAIPYLQDHARFLLLVGNFPVYDHLSRLISMHVIDKGQENK